MSAREAMLGRVREALRVSASAKGSREQRSEGGGVKDREATQSYRGWLPPAGATFEEWCERFGRNIAALKGEFVRVATLSEAGALVARMAGENGWEAVGIHRHPLIERVVEGLRARVVRTDGGYKTAELERCAAGITACEALVAQTGSVLVSSRGSGGRALSILPPHHIVVAEGNQLVADLTDAFTHVRRVYGREVPSCLSFITGPSRTGDIERILVLGAHGPRRLTIVMVG